MAAKKKIPLMTIFRFLGVGLFVFFLTRIDLQNTFRILAETNMLYYFAAFVFAMLVLVFKGIRWHYLNHGKAQRHDWLNSLYRFYESYAIGVFTPGRVGEFVKAGYEKEKNTKISSLLRMLAERGIDVGMFLLFAALGIVLLYVERIPNWIGWLIFSGALALILMSMLLLTTAWIYDFLSRTLSLLFKKDIRLQANNYPPKSTFIIIITSLLSNLSHFISVFLLALSLDMDIAFLYLASGIAISGILNLIPVSIMGLGTREATLFYVFSHSDQSLLLALSALILLTAQLGGGIVSFIAAIIFKKAISDH